MTSPIVVASSYEPSTEGAVAELHAILGGDRPALVLFFHSPGHPASVVASLAQAAFPGAVTAGCSTMGEICDGQFVRGGMVAMAFSGAARVAAEGIADLSPWRFEQGAALVGRLCAGLGCTPAQLRPDRHLLLTLLDGLSGSDELLLTAIMDAVPGLPLVGGCAADDERFEATWTFLDGQAGCGGAVVLLVEPGVPFVPFALHHYRPTGQRVVVTCADPARRLVLELDGWPAVDAYARLCGLPAERFAERPDLLLGQAVQFGVRTGDTRFVRGVMTARGDALVLAGAVEEGEILEVMEATDLVESTREGLAGVLDTLGAPVAALLLFSCGGRFHAAERAGELEPLAQAMAVAPVAGMSTYGEHFGSLLLNYTLTGVAFARGPGEGA